MFMEIIRIIMDSPMFRINRKSNRNVGSGITRNRTMTTTNSDMILS
jgi:hypothetical protein